MSVNAFWKLKKCISKSGVGDKYSVIDENGIEIFNPEGIKNEYAKEFQNRLSHRKIDDKLVEYQELSNKLLSQYLQKAAACKTQNYTTQEVRKEMNSFQKGKASGPDHYPPDILPNASEPLVENLTTVLNTIKDSLTVPEEWYNMLITTIYKGKGRFKKLRSYRGIFLTSVLSKLMEKLIKTRINPHIEKVNRLQAGSRRNRSTCDSIFLLKGLIDHACYIRCPLYITMYDYSTCFDSLWLEDCLLTLHKLGVQSDLIVLIHELNKKATITVNTPFGKADTFRTTNIVKQGTVLGGILCSSSTAEYCDEKRVGGVSVGDVQIPAIMYVDDTNDVNTNINDTIEAHNNFIRFSARKRLQLNEEKCSILIVNKKQTDSTPYLVVNEKKIEAVKQAKVLGDMGI